MTIRENNGVLRSDRTPETATRTAHGRWHVSWLPDHILTRDQAYCAMMLDETLSDPNGVGDEWAWAQAEVMADQIGITLRETIVELNLKMLERDSFDLQGDAA